MEQEISELVQCQQLVLEREALFSYRSFLIVTDKHYGSEMLKRPCCDVLTLSLHI